jgi:hypothetical protein
MRVDLGPPPPLRSLPWFAPKWRFSRVQSESVLLAFRPGAKYNNLRTGRRRPYSEPPGFNRPAGAQQPLVVPAPPPAAPPPWLCGAEPEATLGFRPLPVFNAVSGNHMTNAQRARHILKSIFENDHMTPPVREQIRAMEPDMLYLNVDITHTVADAQSALRRWFQDPQLTVVKPNPEDPSLPIRAMTTNEMQQGLYIYLPSPPERGSLGGRHLFRALKRNAAALRFEKNGRDDHGRRGRR